MTLEHILVGRVRTRYCWWHTLSLSLSLSLSLFFLFFCPSLFFSYSRFCSRSNSHSGARALSLADEYVYTTVDYLSLTFYLSLSPSLPLSLSPSLPFYPSLSFSFYPSLSPSRSCSCARVLFLCDEYIQVIFDHLSLPFNSPPLSLPPSRFSSHSSSRVRARALWERDVIIWENAYTRTFQSYENHIQYSLVKGACTLN